MTSDKKRRFLVSGRRTNMIGSATNWDFPILLVDVFLYFAIEFPVEEKRFLHCDIHLWEARCVFYLALERKFRRDVECLPRKDCALVACGIDWCFIISRLPQFGGLWTSLDVSILIFSEGWTAFIGIKCKVFGVARITGKKKTVARRLTQQT